MRERTLLLWIPPPVPRWVLAAAGLALVAGCSDAGGPVPGGSAFADTAAVGDAGVEAEAQDAAPGPDQMGSSVCETLVCEDGNPCTTDGCDPATGCRYTPNNQACDDGDPCTVGDNCLQGECAGVQEPACDCTVDADCEALDDGDPCTGVLVCVASQCTLQQGSVVTCAPSTTPCTVAVCDTATGACIDSPIIFGDTCDDGDACTDNDVCLQGVCKPGAARDCDDGEGCTVDTCDPASGCVHTPSAGTECDDGDLCTTADTCVAGVCVGSLTACNDGDPCTGDETCDGTTGECATAFPDADADEVTDACDVCAGHDDKVDLDGNGTPDGCDAPGAPPAAPANATFGSCGDFLCCAGDGVGISWDASPGATHYRLSWVCGFAIQSSGDVADTSLPEVLGAPYNVGNCNPVGNFEIKACKGAACSAAVQIGLQPFTCGGGCCAF